MSRQNLSIFGGVIKAALPNVEHWRATREYCPILIMAQYKYRFVMSRREERAFIAEGLANAVDDIYLTVAREITESHQRDP